MTAWGEIFFLLFSHKRKQIFHNPFLIKLVCHALLSSALVLYSSYSLRFILVVLRAYFLHQACVQTICEQAGISVSTLYRWKSLFLTHKALWLGAMESLEASVGSFLDGLDGVLLQGFCLKFLFSFLQRPGGTFPDLPPGTSGQTSGST